MHDYEESLSGITKRQLLRAGYSIVSFPSFDGFLNEVSSYRDACLVLELQSSGTAGLSLLRRLRTGGVDLPVIFITAFDDAEWQASIHRYDGVVSLSTPYSEQELLKLIDRVMSDSSNEEPARGSRRLPEQPEYNEGRVEEKVGRDQFFLTTQWEKLAN